MEEDREYEVVYPDGRRSTPFAVRSKKSAAKDFRLHVWGPAFGLDSIDPECIAAITAFRVYVPLKHWTLIASNDTSVSPDYRLPALEHGGRWYSGYASIISYLELVVLDNDIIAKEEADSLACSSFLATRGAGLLAMSLYVSPRAWVEMTRPAYSSLLRFPLTWTVPPAIRAAAVEKAEHYGIGYLAAEVDAEECFSSTPAETTSTGFLRLRERLGPSKTMRPEHTATIRFQHFAEDFYQVLDEQLGDKNFLLADERISSLDFLAYGYLELMQVQTPHPILRNVLQDSYPRLVKFLSSMRRTNEISPDLPWQEPAPTGALSLIGRFAEGSLEALPGVGDSWTKWRKGGVTSWKEDDVKDSSQLMVAVGGAVVSVAALGAVALFRTLWPFGASTHRFEPKKEEKTGLHQFGEIGSILDGLPVWEQPRSFSPA